MRGGATACQAKKFNAIASGASGLLFVAKNCAHQYPMRFKIHLRSYDRQEASWHANILTVATS
ncbi:MAG TPA: hypothetical protein VL002_00845, partial [Candidimonas sp.]|nr:hypothetical protein [Candidimonas sp.]